MQTQKMELRKLRKKDLTCDGILIKIMHPQSKITAMYLDPIQDDTICINLEANNIKVDKIEIAWFVDVRSIQK